MKARAIAIGLAVGLVSAMGVLTLSQGTAEAKAIKAYAMPIPFASASPAASASPEVLRISALGAKDMDRARKELLALYRQDGLRSGPDYRAAAKMLEGSKDRQELLMAHDLAVAALALGDGEARMVVARTEDILFKSVGLGERYGTQQGQDLPLTPAHRRLMITGVASRTPDAPATQTTT